MFRNYAQIALVASVVLVVSEGSASAGATVIHPNGNVYLSSSLDPYGTSTTHSVADRNQFKATIDIDYSGLPDITIPNLPCKAGLNGTWFVDADNDGSPDSLIYPGGVGSYTITIKLGNTTVASSEGDIIDPAND